MQGDRTYDAISNTHFLRVPSLPFHFLSLSFRHFPFASFRFSSFSRVVSVIYFPVSSRLFPPCPRSTPFCFPQRAVRGGSDRFGVAGPAAWNWCENAGISMNLGKRPSSCAPVSSVSLNEDGRGRSHLRDLKLSSRPFRVPFISLSLSCFVSLFISPSFPLYVCRLFLLSRCRDA